MVEQVRRSGAAAAYGRPGARTGAGRGFALPAATSGEAGVVVAAAAAGGLLALQAAAEDAQRDAAARRRGAEILDELSALQRDLLAGHPPSERAGRLATLADGEAGADPGLRDILAALSLRARVQAALARPR